MRTPLRLNCPSILIAQKATPSLSSQYASLTVRFGAQLHFQESTETQFISAPQFRTYKAMIVSCTSFLFTNRVSMDGFFKLAFSCGITFPPSTKYFLAIPGLENCLRKYIELRKRKVFCGEKKLEDLFDLFSKHKNERFLFPCSNLGKPSIGKFFKEKKYNYTELPIYSTVGRDLSNLSLKSFDTVVFFSSFAVQSFAKNFPNFDFSKLKIVALGTKTVREIEKQKWQVTIVVPSPEAPSVLQGLANYFERQKQKKEKISPVTMLVEERTVS